MISYTTGTLVPISGHTVHSKITPHLAHCIQCPDKNFSMTSILPTSKNSQLKDKGLQTTKEGWTRQHHSYLLLSHQKIDTPGHIIILK